MINCKYLLMRPIDFINQIDDNQLQIGELIWNINRQIELLEDIKNNYPIGNIILCTVDNRTITLDGDQRVSIIYNAFSKNSKLFFDLQQNCFQDFETSNTIPTNVFLYTHKFISKVEKLPEQLIEAAYFITNHFLNYVIPVANLTKLTIEDAKKIYEKSNNKKIY